MTAVAAQPGVAIQPGRAYSLALILSPRNRSARAAVDVAAWLGRLELEGKRPRTVSAYQQTGDRLLDLYPDTPLVDLTAGDLETLLRQFPAASRHIRRAHLSSLFTYAELARLIPDNPMRYVAKIRPPKQKQKPAFTRVEKELLMAHDPKMAVLFLSGIRLSEAIHLQGRHVVIDPEPDGAITGRLLIKDGKGGKDRTVQMRKLAGILNDYLLFNAVGPKDYLWEHRKYPHRAEPLSPGAFYEWWRRCLADTGVQPGQRTVHSTRHTFAYHWIADGGSLERLSLMLGHESIQTTYDLYVKGHMTAADVASDLELVEG